MAVDGVSDDDEGTVHGGVRGEKGREGGGGERRPGGGEMGREGRGERGGSDMNLVLCFSLVPKGGERGGEGGG